ncbi:LysR family transcriptional regulator, partial [Halomonas sp. ND22Bw]|uniref:LysR substrate-binding domain-containing protein n=1 Tax=Halomonas sp. ND22Bw TaxID=2054178 RepID=UPI000D2C713B
PLLSGPQLERLQDGSLDAGILYLDDDSQPGLEARLLQRDHLILAVPAHSSWSETPPTSLQDAANADFIWGFREASPHY